MGQPRKARIVEVEPSGITWRKSTASSGNDGQCIEVAHLDKRMLVRSSHDPYGARLSLPTPAWTALLARVHGDDVT